MEPLGWHSIVSRNIPACKDKNHLRVLFVELFPELRMKWRKLFFLILLTRVGIIITVKKRVGGEILSLFGAEALVKLKMSAFLTMQEH